MLPGKLADDPVRDLQSVDGAGRKGTWLLPEGQHTQVVQERDELGLRRQRPDTELPQERALDSAVRHDGFEQRPALGRRRTGEDADALEVAVGRAYIEVQHVGRIAAEVLKL